jgi:hypothetical protein
MLGDSYASTVELEYRLGSDDDGTFGDILAAASRAVESFTRRQFNKTTTATARRFRPLDWRRLPVDDFHTATGLVVNSDGAVWDLADVDPQPWNGTVDGQTGWPFFNLYAVNRSFSAAATITVTAQWGWAAVPAGIREATLAVAEGMHSKAPGKTRAFAIDGYSESFVVEGEELGAYTSAEPYRRKRFGIA